ncbi:uncharacterized protein LOC131249592 [Magnolia sinica]|uniref:uncharacterized protein LOC131249592 n=1 Tax=Magnolia sinica TaxID=86752 RepID=UPI0026587814|nr:uncharacterized protein LOC131249592 [Magnolia sinica]
MRDHHLWDNQVRRQGGPSTSKSRSSSRYEGGWELVRPRRPLPGESSSLFVGNISFVTKSDYLAKIFGKYGKITDIYIPWNRSIQRPQGYAFICFFYEDDVHAAMGVLNGKRVDGRILSISRAKPHSNASARPST